MIVLPWGKYKYVRLPMGVCNSPDIFQEQMSDLMSGLEFVHVYIDDILCITKDNFQDHLWKLEKVFMRIQDANLRINAKKSFFAKPEVTYLEFKINRLGIMPLIKKVKAILALKPPETWKQLRHFIGMINYYRDMWPRCSEILVPLSRLQSKDVKFHWTETEQKAFETMKRVISKDILLTYPDFNKPFEIYTDASHTQLGAVITQDNKPIAFYSRKLQSAQTRYTTTERELLSIVETLKEFRNILFGHQIKIYTDHKNLTFKDFTTERVLRWRLLVEEFSPDTVYLKGKDNIIADALSRMNIAYNPYKETETYDSYEMAEAFSEDISGDVFPLKYALIDKYQQKDKNVLLNLQYACSPFNPI